MRHPFGLHGYHRPSSSGKINPLDPINVMGGTYTGPKNETPLPSPSDIPPPPPPPPSLSSPQVQQAAADAKKKAAQNAGSTTVATTPAGAMGAVMTTSKSLLGQ